VVELATLKGRVDASVNLTTHEGEGRGSNQLSANTFRQADWLSGSLMVQGKTEHTSRGGANSTLH